MNEKNTMHTLFWSHLEDLRASENATRRALESLLDMTPAADMRATMNSWLGQNRDQVDRLRAILRARPEDLSTESLPPAESARWETYLGPGLQESGTVVAVQFLTRYKIAAYQAARHWAIMLGYLDIVTPLQQSLMEEHRQAEQLSAFQEGYRS
ncbi:MAG: DUF892 family protein [Gemmatimonadota bacterium]